VKGCGGLVCASAIAEAPANAREPEPARLVLQLEHRHQYVRSSGCHLVMVTGE
jgi:hypothetical protein